MALSLISGNVFQFDSIAASGEATCEFGLPIKKFMVGIDDIIIQSDDGVDLINLAANTVYEFPNNYGYPGYLNVKNGDNSNPITPSIYVVEFGDVIKADYFEDVTPV